jgi:hypothetical protein
MKTAETLAPAQLLVGSIFQFYLDFFSGPLTI